MRVRDVEDLIAQSLNLHADAAINRAEPETPDLIEQLHSIRRFTDDGVLTTDAGLVLRFDDGTEFQITIVRSN